MTDTSKGTKTDTTTHTVRVGGLDAAALAQCRADAKAFTDDVARIEALATEATYIVSTTQSVIDICALALNHAQSHEGRVVGQVMAVLDLLSDHLETKLEGELTKLDLGVTKIARGLKDKGVVLWP